MRPSLFSLSFSKEKQKSKNTGKRIEMDALLVLRNECNYSGVYWYNTPCHRPITTRASDQLLYNTLFLVSEQLL